MKSSVTYRRVPIGSLIPHEEVDPPKVLELLDEFRRTGVVQEPILIDRGSRVILNGHHRWAALKELGVSRAPVWQVEYTQPSITIDRWEPGPTVTKAEVLDRARNHRLFPPKTTRHRFGKPPMPRATSIAELAGTTRRSRAGRKQPTPGRYGSGVPVPSRAGADSSGGE